MEAPQNTALASAFVAAAAADVFARSADLANWPRLFPGWIVRVETDEERFSATGPNGERFDLYPHADARALALDVEVVDELGSADTLRLRALDTAGGCFVVVAHGKLAGSPAGEWEAKRRAIATGLDGVAALV